MIIKNLNMHIYIYIVKVDINNNGVINNHFSLFQINEQGDSISILWL